MKKSFAPAAQHQGRRLFSSGELGVFPRPQLWVGDCMARTRTMILSDGESAPRNGSVGLIHIGLKHEDVRVLTLYKMVPVKSHNDF